MGIQSRRRLGSIKACKKRATSRKFKKKQVAKVTVTGREVFIPEEHCRICKKKAARAAGLKVNIPKRAHHDKCLYKLTNKKKFSTHRVLDFLIVDGKTGKMVKPAQAVVVSTKPTSPPVSHESVTNQVNPSPAQNDGLDGGNDGRSESSSRFYDCRDKEVDLATDIRLEVHERLELVTKGDDKFKFANKSSLPKTIMLAIDYLVGLFSHRRPKNSNGVLRTSMTK